jgi:hypothetical protein
MELGPSFHGLPLAASALLRGRTLTVTEIFSIFFVFFPVQKPQSKKLAFRILSLRSRQKHHWEAPNPNEGKKTAAVATAEFELQRDVAKLFICRLLLPSRALRCRKGCQRGRRTGIRYGSPVTTGAVSPGIRYDRSETAEAAAPAQ